MKVEILFSFIEKYDKPTNFSTKKPSLFVAANTFLSQEDKPLFKMLIWIISVRILTAP